MGDIGVSVLLKGNSRRELVVAKKILKFMLLVKYSSNLEINFLTMFNSIERNQWLQTKNFSNKLNNENDNKNDLFHCELCEFNESCNVISDLNPSVFFLIKFIF